MTIGFKGFNMVKVYRSLEELNQDIEDSFRERIVMQEEEYIDLKNRIVEEKLK
jgi:hypothetical protein